jgi:uncharacterized protein (TIGR02757 family)
LARRLESLAERYGPAHLDSDPLQFPRRYGDPADREAAAFVAAGLAFGSARSICASLGRAFAFLGSSPSLALDRLALGRGPEAPPGTLHRWVQWKDLADYLACVGRLRREAGGLEEAFLEGDPGRGDLAAALAAFVGRLRAHGPQQPGRGLRYLLVSPENRSACKRWNLLLRWLVRPDDGLDLGLWRRIAPSRLLVPLDTHMARIAFLVGLSHRRTADWRTAAAITAALAEIDPRDPVRFDFALTRLGILDLCPRSPDPERCAACALREVCSAP